jgi:ketosteroid isomerase-like protein
MLVVLLVGGCSPAVQRQPVEVMAVAQAYVDAVAGRDLEGLVNAFHPDGQVIDVSRTIAGHARGPITR